MATSTDDDPGSAPEIAFDCPRCATAISRVEGLYVCPDCGFAPRHGAD